MWIICIPVGAGAGSILGFFIAAARMLDGRPGILPVEPLNLLVFCGGGFVAGAIFAPILFAAFWAAVGWGQGYLNRWR